MKCWGDDGFHGDYTRRDSGHPSRYNVSMQINFAFGRTGLTLDLPEGLDYHVLEARSAVPLHDTATALAQALDAPIDCPPLAEMARGKRSAAISVCDITRPAPNREVLPSGAGPIGGGRHCARSNYHSHRHGPAPASDGTRKFAKSAGKKTAARYRVLNHHARELSEHRSLGKTAAGTPVYIDDRFVSADLHITLGFIEPHLMLGYSGGRKLIAPGLAAQETIKVLHSPRFMRDPRAVEGSIEDNPLHRELLEIARMARHDFLADVALGRGAPRRPIAAVFAGEPVAAHRKGVEFVSRVMLETLDHPVDAVITTAAGYPLDLTFYQAVKGITAASHIVKPGGKILLLAACDEGVGGPEFARMLADRSPDHVFMKKIDGMPVIVDQWQLEKLALVTTRAQVLYYVPGLPREFHSALWGKAYAGPEEAIRALVGTLRKNARIAVIPEGPYVLAQCADLVNAIC